MLYACCHELHLADIIVFIIAIYVYPADLYISLFVYLIFYMTITACIFNTIIFYILAYVAAAIIIIILHLLLFLWAIYACSILEVPVTIYTTVSWSCVLWPLQMVYIDCGPKIQYSKPRPQFVSVASATQSYSTAFNIKSCTKYACMHGKVGVVYRQLRSEGKRKIYLHGHSPHPPGPSSQSYIILLCIHTHNQRKQC